MSRKSLYEDERLRVWRVDMQPNTTMATHRHDSARVVIPLSSVGLVKFYDDGSPSEDVRFEVGSIYHFDSDPPGQMHGYNILETTDAEAAPIIVVELK